MASIVLGPLSNPLLPSMSVQLSRCPPLHCLTIVVWVCLLLLLVGWLFFDSLHIEDDLRLPPSRPGLALALRTPKCMCKAVAEVLTPLCKLLADSLFHGGQSRCRSRHGL